MSKNSGKPPLEKALDLFVYAPVGVALYVRDTVPMFVNLFVSRGRSELNERRRHARDRVTQARAMGEFAVEHGGPKMRARVEQGLSTARKSAEAVVVGFGNRTEPEANVPNSGRVKPPAPASAPPAEGDKRDAVAWRSSGPSASALVIPDYDELSASQVVERLDGLRSNELQAVHDYEEAHRGRRTILFKIEQLTHP